LYAKGNKLNRGKYMTIVGAFLIVAVLSAILAYFYNNEKFDKITLAYFSGNKKKLNPGLECEFKKMQYKFCLINALICSVLTIIQCTIIKLEIQRNIALVYYIFIFILIITVFTIHRLKEKKFFS